MKVTQMFRRKPQNTKLKAGAGAAAYAGVAANVTAGAAGAKAHGIMRRLANFVPIALVAAATIFSGAMLASGAGHADNPSASSTATVNVSDSCSFLGTVTEPHEGTIQNGQYRVIGDDDNDGVGGRTILRTYCNDSHTYSITAVGYTGCTSANEATCANQGSEENPTNTRLVSDVVGSTPIQTGEATSGNTSAWAMKISAVAGDGTTTQTANVENGYGDKYQVIPASPLTIASYTATTDAATDSSITTSYAAYISHTQTSGTYTGQVKYTLIHSAVIFEGITVNFDSNVSSVAVKSSAGCTSGNTLGTISTSGNNVSGLIVGETYYLCPTFAPNHEYSSWTAGTGADLGTPDDDGNVSFTISATGGSATLASATSKTTLAVSVDASQVSSVAIKSGSATGSTVATVSADNSWTSSKDLVVGTTYYLVPTYVPNHEFDNTNGWVLGNNISFASGSSKTTATPGIVPSSTAAATITLNSKSSRLYMQDLTLTACQKNVSNGIGEVITAYDARDEKDYTVRYINGRCWMTQNLRFTGTSLNTTTSNVGTNKTISYGALTSGNSYDEARIQDSGNKSTGVWYNFAAASAMYVTGSSNNSNSDYDICPKNWHLPTGPYSTSGTDGYTIFNNNTYGSWVDMSSNTYIQAFGAVAGGYYSGGSLGGQAYGYWWSATAYGTTYRYVLYYNSSNGQFISGSDGRQYGLFVRCVRSTS